MSYTDEPRQGSADAATYVRAVVSTPEPEPSLEGWGVIRPSDRKAHYYRDGFSLCRRVGFYSGPLEPDDHPSPDDHKECRRRLDREKEA